MIDKNKSYRTRDGREVRIYATDGGNAYKVHGAVRDNGIWLPQAWLSDGKVSNYDEHDVDLIEVRPRIKRTVWLHLWKNGTVCATEESYYVPTGRIACVQVEIDVEEGQGL